MKHKHRNVMKYFTQPILAIGMLLCAQLSFAGVELPNGIYYDNTDDLVVKVKGGYVKAGRTWYDGQWYFNRGWNQLSIEIDSLNGSVKSLTRNGAKYTRPSSGSTRYEFDKRKWFRTIGTGFRWEDREGNWIEYDTQGVIQKYGDRNNVEVTFQYDTSGKLQGVFDHFGTQVLWYSYYPNDQLQSIRDATAPTPRQVQYSYTGTELTQVTDANNNNWTYSYTSGRLTTITDPDSRPTTIAYHATGAAKSMTKADGTGTSYTFNYDKSKREYYVAKQESSGRLLETWYNKDGENIRRDLNGTTTESVVRDVKKDTVTNELGQVTVREYDDFDNLIKITYPDNKTVNFTYNTKYSNILSYTDERGVITQFGYDGNGNLNKVTEALSFPEQRVINLTPNTYGEYTRIERVGDAVTQLSATDIIYDTNTGNVTRITDPEGHSTNLLTYDLMGNPLSWRDGRSKLWQAQFDNMGKITRFETPTTTFVRVQYDGAGNLTHFYDPLNKHYERKYDNNNRLFEIVNPYLDKKQFTYQPNGLPKDSIDEEGKINSQTFNALGLSESVIDGNNNVVSYVYGKTSTGALLEQVSEITNPATTQSIEYDIRNRVSKTIDKIDVSTFATTKYKYDATGNVTEVENPDQLKTIYQYDVLKRVTQITDTNQQITQYSYDNRNNILSVTNENNIVIRIYQYDRKNLLTQAKWNTGETFNYTYDASGNLETKIDGKRQRTLFVYDDVNRLDRKELYQTVSATTPIKLIQFSYNAAGSLTGYNDGAVSSVYTYDDLQRRLSEIFNYPGFSRGQAYTFYKNSKLKTYTGPDTIQHTYVYDTNNQLSSLTIPGEGSLVINAYKWFAPTQITMPGGGKQTKNYDALMRIEKLQSLDNAGNSLRQYDYGYDLVDNLRSKIDTKQTGSSILKDTINYSYDNNYRLRQVDHTNPSVTNQLLESFSYDPAGNRQTSNATSGNWQINLNNNQLDNDTVNAYTYDANGSLFTKTTSGQTQTYVYDLEGRLSQVQDNASQPIADYYYDPFGRRLWKEVAGVRTYFMYRAEGLSAELDASGTVTQTYDYTPGSAYGTLPLLTRTSAGTFYYHLDHLGTPEMLTDKSGAVAWRASYKAFGEATVGINTVTNNLRFPGQYYDVETGTHYNYFRDYDPSTGRYVQSDPIGLNGGLNTYGYVGGNPMMFRDILGLRYSPHEHGRDWDGNLLPGRNERGQSIFDQGFWDYFSDLYGDMNPYKSGSCEAQRRQLAKDITNELLKELPSDVLQDLLKEYVSNNKEYVGGRAFANMLHTFIMNRLFMGRLKTGQKFGASGALGVGTMGLSSYQALANAVEGQLKNNIKCGCDK